MSSSRLARRLARNVVLASAIALVMGAAAWLVHASAQQDFAAYYVAGQARRLGLDPYVNGGGAPGAAPWDGVAVFAHSRFLYPPLVANLFRPWAALPYPTAKALFTALSVAAWVAATFTSARLFDRAGRGGAVAVAAVAGALFFPLYLHIERGQIDLVALLLLLGAWAFRARALVAGGALAAAATLKPGLAGVVPVIWALGRWRVTTAAVAWVAALAAATAAISGPALLVEYATRVLPRAARFGEGGAEEMLLPPDRLAALAPALESGMVSLGGGHFPLTAWDGPVAASLPRLLSPEGPSRAAGLLSALLALAALLALLALLAAARVVRRRGRPPEAEAALLFAAALACVIGSPAGWLMGYVFALPLVSIARAGLAAGTIRRGPGRALGIGLLACACPPLPVPGWAALAGAAVVVAAAAVAVAEP